MKLKIYILVIKHKPYICHTWTPFQPPMAVSVAKKRSVPSSVVASRPRPVRPRPLVVVRVLWFHAVLRGDAATAAGDETLQATKLLLGCGRREGNRRVAEGILEHAAGAWGVAE